MNIELVVTNIACGLSFILTVAFGLVVYLKSSRKMINVTFLMMSFAVALFQIGYVFGINAIGSNIPGNGTILAISSIFIGIFNFHWIVSVLSENKERLKFVISVYVVGSALTIFYILYPSWYLLPSISKMYLPNYFVPGNYFFLSVIFLVCTISYSTLSLLRAYRIANRATKNKLLYFISSMFIGFPLGASGLLLVYDVPFDPIFSVLFSLYIIPLAYGILKYDLMEVRLIAKKALTYALVIGGIGFAISGINILNNTVLANYPFFPDWAVPLFSAILMALLGGYVWEKFRDLDVLKYEFITVVTHRFRTPLTRIKWATEMLHDKESDQTKLDTLQEISLANELLVELTDMLVGLGKFDDTQYLYTIEEFNIDEKINKILVSIRRHIQDKDLEMTFDCEKDLPVVQADARRLQFALQIVIENAISYTPAKRKVAIKAFRKESHVLIEVKDSGIGIAKEDISLMFSKFFRSHEARTSDTEGMGIGLFMAKKIIERHDGGITVSSEGLGKGATFTVSIPFIK